MPKGIINFGPYKGRGFGNIPILFTYWLLHKHSSEIKEYDLELYNYLLARKQYIYGGIGKFQKKYIDTQIALIENTCNVPKGG